MATALQAVLTVEADRAAQATGCVQRVRKFRGATLVQTLVFGWLAQPEATGTQLRQMGVRLGVVASLQALAQRFTPALAACLERVLEAALRQVVVSDPTVIPLLARFRGVYLLDSTTIALPDALATVWPGCGGRTETGTAAALKLQISRDVVRGALHGSLHAGREQDQTAPELTASLPPGALRIQDLGYFSLGRLAAWGAAGGCYLSRLKAGVAVCTPDGRRWEAGRLLGAQPGAVIDLAVSLGVAERLPCRLIAVRVPAAVAAERRRKLRAAAQREGQTVSAARLTLADWTVLVTNLGAGALAVAEALVLARVRWQIECVVTRWKDGGKVDESRSEQPWRILCEVYAKLIGMLIQHWLILTAGWTAPDTSLPKAAAVVRAEMPALARALAHPAHLTAVLATIAATLRHAGCVTRRRRRPAAVPLLRDPSRQSLPPPSAARTIRTPAAEAAYLDAYGATHASPLPLRLGHRGCPKRG
ncbi:MAG TPA: IS4 family transposase, partial [Vicinamibacteria bacterium]|nr:IS4 family transposase [Vicinamibacteria bacterium]